MWNVSEQCWRVGVYAKKQHLVMTFVVKSKRQILMLRVRHEVGGGTQGTRYMRHESTYGARYVDHEST